MSIRILNPGGGTPPPVTLNAPINVIAGTPVQNTIPLTWTASAQGDATGYLVKDNSDDSTVATVVWPATGTTVVGLAYDTSYDLYVVTTDGTSVSSKSNIVTAQTEVYVPSGPGYRRVMNFESGTVGQPAIGDDAGYYTFQGNGCFTEYSDPTLSMYGGAPWNATAHSGTQCCEIHWAPGTGNGVGNSPGILLPFQQDSVSTRYNPGEGDEIWMRWWWWWPSTWQDSPEGGRTKGIRVRSSGGWHDLYPGPDHDSWTPSSYAGGCYWNTAFGLLPPPNKLSFPKSKGVWECFEWNIKLASSQDTGHYRVWQNDVLIIDDIHCETIYSGDTFSGFGFIWGEWHPGVSPVDQSAFVDDIIVTDNNPGQLWTGTSPTPGVGEAVYPFIGKDALT